MEFTKLGFVRVWQTVGINLLIYRRPILYTIHIAVVYKFVPYSRTKACIWIRGGGASTY